MARSRSRRCPTLTMAGSGPRRADEEPRRASRSAARSPRARCAGGARPPAAATSASRRSSESARWAPRLSPATAWISSTITVRTPASPRRPDSDGEQDEERLGRGHEHVRRALRALPALVRPGCRRCARRCGCRARARPARPPAARQLAERLLEVAADVVGERLERRDVDDLGAVLERGRPRPCGRAASRQARKAARVLPEPVGAVSSTSWPSAMTGQPRPGRAVGSAKRRGTTRLPRVEHQGMEHAFSIASAASRLSPRRAGPEISGRGVA